MNDLQQPSTATEPLEADDLESGETGIFPELAALPPGTLITEDGLAGLLGRTCRETIKRAVERGELPRPVKLMGKNTWTAGAIIQHVEDRLKDEARRHGKMHA
jgi:predicted DNA-binding transcriptional regulator AlpA